MTSGFKILPGERGGGGGLSAQKSERHCPLVAAPPDKCAALISIGSCSHHVLSAFTVYTGRVSPLGLRLAIIHRYIPKMGME